MFGTSDPSEQDTAVIGEVRIGEGDRAVGDDDIAALRHKRTLQGRVLRSGSTVPFSAETSLLPSTMPGDRAVHDPCRSSCHRTRRRWSHRRSDLLAEATRQAPADPRTISLSVIVFIGLSPPVLCGADSTKSSGEVRPLNTFSDGSGRATLMQFRPPDLASYKASSAAFSADDAVS